MDEKAIRLAVDEKIIGEIEMEKIMKIEIGQDRLAKKGIDSKYVYIVVDMPALAELAKTFSISVLEEKHRVYRSSDGGDYFDLLADVAYQKINFSENEISISVEDIQNGLAERKNEEKKAQEKIKKEREERLQKELEKEEKIKKQIEKEKNLEGVYQILNSEYNLNISFITSSSVEIFSKLGLDQGEFVEKLQKEREGRWKIEREKKEGERIARLKEGIEISNKLDLPIQVELREAKLQHIERDHEIGRKGEVIKRDTVHYVSRYEDHDDYDEEEEIQKGTYKECPVAEYPDWIPLDKLKILDEKITEGFFMTYEVWVDVSDPKLMGVKKYEKDKDGEREYAVTLGEWT